MESSLVCWPGCEVQMCRVSRPAEAYQFALLNQMCSKHGEEEAIEAIRLTGQAVLAHPHLQQEDLTTAM